VKEASKKQPETKRQERVGVQVGEHSDRLIRPRTPSCEAGEQPIRWNRRDESKRGAEPERAGVSPAILEEKSGDSAVDEHMEHAEPAGRRRGWRRQVPGDAENDLQRRQAQ
jgi:hypothetical protein